MTQPSKKEIRKVVWASLLGATIEWYDFFLYGVVAGIVFNKLFFPTSDPYIGTLLAYTTFAIGYLARPFGGFIFGHFGDKIGRKSMLILTMLIMGLATIGIGLVPTYASIGIAAPILLQTFRLLQGLGLGGEWGGAVLMTYEYASKKERAFYASIPQMGLATGLCLSSGVVALLSMTLSDAQFLEWGWRVAFLMSVFFNVLAVFVITYLVQYIHVDRTSALVVVMIAALLMCPFIAFFGHMADKYGRGKVYGTCAVLCGISIFPSFWLMQNSNGNLFMIAIAIIIPLSIFYAGIFGPEAAVFADLFPADVRYTGISICYQFPGFLVAGIVPGLCTYFMGITGGDPIYVCLYTMLACFTSALAGFVIQKRHNAAVAKYGDNVEHI